MSQRSTGSYTHANGFPDFWEEFWTKLKMLTCFDKMGHVLCRILREIIEEWVYWEHIGSPYLWAYATLLHSVCNCLFHISIKRQKNMIYTWLFCNTTFWYIEGVERKNEILFFILQAFQLFVAVFEYTYSLNFFSWNSLFW